MHLSLSLCVGSRGARGAVAPLDFWLNRKFGKQVWSDINVKILVFVWVIAVAPLLKPSPTPVLSMYIMRTYWKKACCSVAFLHILFA